jgi:hypothetical protein
LDEDFLLDFFDEDFLPEDFFEVDFLPPPFELLDFFADFLVVAIGLSCSFI